MAVNLNGPASLDPAYVQYGFQNANKGGQATWDAVKKRVDTDKAALGDNPIESASTEAQYFAQLWGMHQSGGSTAATSTPPSVLAQSNAGLQAATAPPTVPTAATSATPSSPETSMGSGNITSLAAPAKKKITAGSMSTFPSSNFAAVRSSLSSKLY